MSSEQEKKEISHHYPPNISISFCQIDTWLGLDTWLTGWSTESILSLLGEGVHL